MIEFACPNEEEIDLLKQHYKRGQGTVSHRAHAILLSSLGKTAFDISQTLFSSEKTIREWIKLWHKTRMASLFSGNYCNENAAKLTRVQKEEIARVLSSAPGDYDIPKNFWDIKSLRSYLVAHFGVVYESERSYHFIFKLNHFSFKLPDKFDVRRNDLGVKKRLAEIRKTILPLLKDPAWAVLVGDESRIVWQAIVRRAWLPTGQKTILKVARENLAQNFSGFLDLKDGTAHLFSIPWQNQKETIKILKLLLRKYPKKRICLVWDNAPWHRGKLIREKLKTDLQQFYLLAFPPYAPDTNPQEHVWKWSKDQISNQQFKSMVELTKSFKTIVTGRNYPYQI